MRLVVSVTAMCLLAAGCSAHSAPPRGGSSPPSASATAQATASTVSGASESAHYVAAVNALCGELLPKILKVTHNGDPSALTVAQYKAEVPAHTALEKWFDHKLARIPVPASARSASAAMRAYVAFADRLDARRLAAADRGQAAFEREIRAENAEYPNDPIKQARDAAGFDSACDAR